MNDRGKATLLPLIPGFNPDKNPRRSFHRQQLFDKIHDGVYYLADESKSYAKKNPPIYATDDCVKIAPTWLSFDRQTLVFKSYFEEESMTNLGSDKRLVNIYFFLEDGTIKISEPPTTNSGMEQGVLVRRQKIPIPNTQQPQYYTVVDLNIGKSPTIFGRVYTIFDCDKFTRQFLTRLGIYVPEPDLEPTENGDEKSKIKSTRKENALSKFLKFDKQILRFFGYWDESDNPNGIIRDVEIYYFLADDTIEIKEILPKSLLKDYGTMHVKKTKIPKCFKHIGPIGMDEPLTILNIMKKDHPKAKNYYVFDPIGRMETDSNYYSEIDLFIGAHLNIFGREIVITNLDEFTKQYYKNKYGLENFTPLEKPGENDKTNKYSERYIPPYNGFGTYEDSLNNCFRIVPRPLKKDFIKFYRFGDHVLRFRAKMLSDIAENANREFIIRLFLMDDTISIYELANEKSGFQSSLFQSRTQVLLPNEEIFSDKKPRNYDKDHFYVGSILNLNGFKFVLVSADLYCIRYMESNPSEFPRSNAKLIMQKIRQTLKPFYKQFIQEYSPSGDDFVWDVNSFKHAMEKYLGDKLSQHEVITIGRRYSSDKKKELRTREYVRSLVHNELRRFSWDTLDRLEQNIHHVDKKRVGYLTRKQLYTILRGSQIPLNLELLNSMLDHINKNNDEKLDCQDLLQFMNVNVDPLPPVTPVDMKTALWWASEKEPDCGTGIDWRAFLKDLDLNEEESIKECSSSFE